MTGNIYFRDWMRLAAVLTASLLIGSCATDDGKMKYNTVGDHTVTYYHDKWVTTVDWLKNGKGDRADGPASVMRDNDTGVVVEEWWGRDGKGDRFGAPAMISRDGNTGKITSEWWYKNGERHRLDGPAIIDVDPKTGVISREQWYKNNLPFRTDGPAYIGRDARTGKVKCAVWYKHGKQYEVSPAVLDAWLKRSGERPAQTVDQRKFCEG